MVQSGPVTPQEPQEGALAGGAVSGHGFLRGAAPGPSDGLQRQRVAWHHAYNLTAHALDRTELDCSDPMTVWGQERHRLCGAFGTIVQVALDDAGWMVIPMTEAGHRARIAAGEELLAWIDPDDADLFRADPDDDVNPFVRIVRWLLGR